MQTTNEFNNRFDNSSDLRNRSDSIIDTTIDFLNVRMALARAASRLIANGGNLDEEIISLIKLGEQYFDKSKARCN